MSLSLLKVGRSRLLFQLSSFGLVVSALLVAFYGLTYITGTSFQLKQVMPARSFDFLAIKGQLRHQLLWQTAFTIHVVGGSIGLVTGAFLLFYRFKKALIHRLTGTIYATALVASGTVALYLSYFASVSPVGVVGFYMTNIGWLAATGMGILAVGKRDWLGHKKWFLRSYSFALIVVSFRILFQLFYSGFGLAFDTAYIWSIWLSLSINVIMAELIIGRRYGSRRFVES